MVTGLGRVPFVLGSLCDSFELVVDLTGEFGLVIAIAKLVLVVDAVDGLALVAHLHEQVGVVIGFLGVEVDVCGTIDLEILIYPLVHCLLVQTLPVDSHLLRSHQIYRHRILDPLSLLASLCLARHPKI